MNATRPARATSAQLSPGQKRLFALVIAWDDTYALLRKMPATAGIQGFDRREEGVVLPSEPGKQPAPRGVGRRGVRCGGADVLLANRAHTFAIGQHQGLVRDDVHEAR